MVTPTTTSIFYCEHTFALLLLLQCKRRHSGLVPCRVLSCVKVVLTLRWWVLMSIFDPLLDTMLDVLSKNWGGSCWNPLPLGYPVVMHRNCQHNDGYRTVSAWNTEEGTCILPWHRTCTPFLPIIFLLSQITVGTCGSACSAELKTCFLGMTVPAPLWPQRCSTMWPHFFITCRGRKCCLKSVNYCCLLLLGI